jgi:hypothetical protein
LAELLINVDPADRIEDLQSLLAWLQRDQAQLGQVKTQHESPAVGHMGMLTTVIVTLGSGGVTALATSLRTWLIQRRSDLSVEISRPDGPTVRIDAKRVADAETLIQHVLGSPQDND